METLQSPTEIYSTLLTLTKPQTQPQTQPQPQPTTNQGQTQDSNVSKETNLPKDVITDIYMYLHDSIIYENNKKYIEKRINSITNVKELFTIHKNDLPHPKNITMDNLRKQLDEELNVRSHILKFSHYCCSGKGLVYKSHTNNPYNPKLLRYI
jgi:hypothetical protein